ncbi:hypothetical protein [Alkaliphilus hydrothermalis]|uniref:UbiA prenyltransferase family protein n=1 Tax=Alkaliphilus hydrothermalis TaxID=1482730 RepID=A0ABS2NLL1_9FIRM|nr:hypothetical protein [Alkaliphilus hydrothermalis]MBM7613838.1 hypothetical protein [Alkaliphilus hydrothermalis]
MWVEIFKRYFAVLLMGVVIKLLDDEVDQDEALRGLPESQLLRDLQRFKLPYSLFFLALAMVLDTNYSFGLFSSAYILGMFHIPQQRLPLKLKSYQETLVVVALNLILIPFGVFFQSFFIVTILQLIDDILDEEYDSTYGYFNFVKRYGRMEVTLVIAILTVASFMISWVNTLVILPTGIFINYLYSWW